MDEAHDIGTEGGAQAVDPCLGRLQIDGFGFVHERADPVDLSSVRKGAAKMRDHLVGSGGRDQHGLDRLASGWLLVEHAQIHVAVLGEREAAGDRRRGHHEDIRRAPLGAKIHALSHAEAVLLVDHSKPKIMEGHIGLEERMGSDEDRDLARCQCRELGCSDLALVASGQQPKTDPGGLGQRFEGFEVLSGEDLGRGHHRGLSPGLDCGEHCHQGDQRLARTDIALQEPVHARGGRHIGDDLFDRAVLCAGRCVGQGGKHPLAQMAVARCGEAFRALHLRPGECQRHLVSEQFVVGEALAGRRVGRKIGRSAGSMGFGEARHASRASRGPGAGRARSIRQARERGPGQPAPRASWSVAQAPG